jgi:hypothetical protein
MSTVLVLDRANGSMRRYLKTLFLVYGTWPRQAHRKLIVIQS